MKQISRKEARMSKKNKENTVKEEKCKCNETCTCGSDCHCHEEAEIAKETDDTAELLSSRIKTLEDALCAIKVAQQKRIIQATKLYLAKHPCYQKYDVRFDAVFVSGLKVKHVKQAFISK